LFQIGQAAWTIYEAASSNDLTFFASGAGTIATLKSTGADFPLGLSSAGSIVGTGGMLMSGGSSIFFNNSVVLSGTSSLTFGALTGSTQCGHVNSSGTFGVISGECITTTGGQTIGGALTLSTTLSINTSGGGSTTFNAALWQPATDNYIELGDATHRFKTAYIGTGATISNTIISSAGILVTGGGYLTANAITGTTLSASSTVTFSSITGSTQFLQVNSSGVVSGGGGHVTSISGSSPISLSGSTGGVTVSCSTCLTTAPSTLIVGGNVGISSAGILVTGGAYIIGNSITGTNISFSGTMTPPSGGALNGTYTCSGVQNIYQIVVSQGIITNYACH
jgi:hypothetical protein